MHTEKKSTLQELVAKAIHYGGDMLEVEHKDHYEEVCVMRNGIGFGIARFKSSSGEGAALRKELYGLAKRSGESLLRMKNTNCAHASMTASVRLLSESRCESASFLMIDRCVR